MAFYTPEELSENLDMLLDKADAGEDIIIRRGKNKSYMLIPVHEEDYTISEAFRKKIAKAREEYKRGETLHFDDAKSMNDWLDSL